MFVEQATAFSCHEETLIGILSMPENKHARVGVLIVVGGPQYRVGSHRQFVQLARALATAGFAVLRFDVRGMGDSSGESTGFESIDDDIAAALDAFGAALPDLEHFVLWGLCDGASAALLYWQRQHDRRVSGLVLANPWLRSTAGLAKTHVKHYYRRRLMEPEFWRKLLTGGVAYKAASELAKNLMFTLRGERKSRTPAADFRALMARGWSGFPGPILLLTSGDDYTAAEFLEGAKSLPQWSGAFSKSGLSHLQFDAADHTFSRARSRLEMEAALVDWLGRALPSRPSA
jgi:uncharacterized protein